MRQNRVAILGGAGFIGRYVVKRLAERGDIVAVGGRNAASAKFLKLKGNVGQVALLNVSLNDERLLRAFVSTGDIVVNLVGVLRESGSQRFEAVHHIGPARLARIAREAGIERFIQMSAIGADPRSPSAYARTKAAGEAAARDAFPTATILRPSAVFGPEDQFFNRFAAIATVSPVLPLIGGGETLFQPVYVGDVAEAVVRVIDESSTAGRTYELGGPKIYSLRALMELLLEEIRRKRLLVSVPFGAAAIQARLLSLLPDAPLTPDQVEMLKYDNIVSPNALGFEALGIEPTAVEAILPTYLDRFRRGGWYAREPAA
ncbi:MAG: complex I NDUFA9 subunit family protein [Alphaproteobacteria bacterium]